MTIFVLRIYQVVTAFTCCMAFVLFFIKSKKKLFSIINTEQFHTNQLIFILSSIILGGFVLYFALQKIILILKNFQLLHFFEEVNVKHFQESGTLFFILSVIIALFPFINGLFQNELSFSFQFDGALFTFLIGLLLFVLSSVFEKAKLIYEENKMTI